MLCSSVCKRYLEIIFVYQQIFDGMHKFHLTSSLEQFVSSTWLIRFETTLILIEVIEMFIRVFFLLHKTESTVITIVSMWSKSCLIYQFFSMIIIIINIIIIIIITVIIIYSPLLLYARLKGSVRWIAAATQFLRIETEKIDWKSTIDTSVEILDYFAHSFELLHTIMRILGQLGTTEINAANNYRTEKILNLSNDGGM